MTEFPSPALNIMRYSWVVSSTKLIRETGFTYKYDSRAAFDDFASAVHRGLT